MSVNITELDQWIAGQTRVAASAMSGAISATHLVKERPGFGQKIIPRPGSVLASPVPAAYDPDPDDAPAPAVLGQTKSFPALTLSGTQRLGITVHGPMSRVQDK
jgi:hypothetical protein